MVLTFLKHFRCLSSEVLAFVYPEKIAQRYQDPPTVGEGTTINKDHVIVRIQDKEALLPCRSAACGLKIILIGMNEDQKRIRSSELLKRNNIAM